MTGQIGTVRCVVKRNNVTIEIAPGVQQKISEETERLGMDKKELVRRIIHWFFELPDEIRADALGVLPDRLKSDVAELLLRRMREGQNK
jgi:hypothetical protein